MRSRFTFLALARLALPRLPFVQLGVAVLGLASCGLGCSSAAHHSTTGTAGNAGTTGTGGAAAGSSGAAGATGTAGNGAGGDTSGAAGTSTSGAGGSTGAAGSAAGAGGDPMDAGAVNSDAAVDGTTGGPPAGWTLTWSDEFNGAAGTKPDPNNWGYDLGGGGWGVAQLQVYTNSAANAAMDGNGNLQMVAIKDAQGNFTSARLKTQNKFQQAYGRFEMRAKAVTGNGMWPAFWMLGDDFNSAGWPQCGEVDIMEIRGTSPFTNLGSLHGPGYSGMHPLTGHFSLPDGGASLSDDFHIYAVEWETNVVRFYVDTNLYETETPANIPTDAGPTAKWVYDHPFFILLNVAVGGRFPGPPDGTVFPQTMLVDYIRVYSRSNGGG